MGLEVADYNDKCNRHWKCKAEVVLLMTEAKVSALLTIR